MPRKRRNRQNVDESLIIYREGDSAGLKRILARVVEPSSGSAPDHRSTKTRQQPRTRQPVRS